MQNTNRKTYEKPILIKVGTLPRVTAFSPDGMTL